MEPDVSTAPVYIQTSQEDRGGNRADRSDRQLALGFAPPRALAVSRTLPLSCPYQGSLPVTYMVNGRYLPPSRKSVPDARLAPQ
jgi:hypothetical protein